MGQAGGVKRLPLLLFGLGIVLCVRIAVPFRANGVVFLADDFARLAEELPGPFAHFFFSTVRWYERVLTEC